MYRKNFIVTVLFGLSLALNIIFTINSINEIRINRKYWIKNQNKNGTQDMSKALIALNNFDYSYIINTNKNYCGKENGKDLLFIAFVPASPNSFEKRDLIRSTWANDKYLKSKAKVIFLLGRSNESIVNLKIKNESLKCSDIVQNDFMDTYYNLTIKTIMGFKWVSSYCQNAKYTLKVDDDVVVNIPFLIDYLETHVKNNTNQKNTLIGNCYKKAKVIRNTKSKFYMSKKEFENDFFGEYCDGPAYIITNNLVLKMYEKSLNTKLLKLEDVYVGLLAKSFNSSFVYINDEYLCNKWTNTIINFEKNKKLLKKYFIYSIDIEHFKGVWNYLVTN